MSEGQLIKKEIINHPEHYFNAQSKSLDARISSVELSEDEKKEITGSYTKKFVRDKVLGLFSVGAVVSELINWNESIDEDLKEAKKEYLLAQYFEKNDQNEEALNQLKNFLINPQGNTLFNKIMRIMDDTPPDMELANHLTTALNHIVQSRFHELFEQHKYALAQIENLTPQALTILSDNKSWPNIALGSFNASGTRITSDWLVEFTQSYSAKKRITDEQVINRVRHSINELINTRLIEAHLEGDNMAKCVITQVGKGILPYINA